MDDYMLYIHKAGCEVTNLIQLSLQDFGGYFVWVSKFFDPRHMYLIFFPLLLPFNRSAGIQVLWTAAITEWLNHVYKWFLFGERPYWWVNTNSFLWNPEPPPVLKQFSITCETGPGSPSGHVMIGSATLFVFVQGLLNVLPKHIILKLLAWGIYAITVISISLSRVYIAAHFPHQCVVGLLCGVILGYFLSNVVIVSNLNLKCHLLMALGTFLVAMTTYFVILNLGIDPNWTLPLAKQWCSRAEWVHLNTTPFFMMWRYTSTLLGIGLALRSAVYLNSTTFQRLSFANKLIFVGCGIFIAMKFEGFIPKKASPMTTYSSEFVFHSIIPVLVLSVLPWAIKAIN